MSTVSLSSVLIGRCWFSSLICRTLGQLLTGQHWAGEPVGPRPTPAQRGEGPVHQVSDGTCARVWGKSCQLRFLRLGGVMSGFCFPSSHWDHTLWWLGFRMMMPNSSETDKLFQWILSHPGRRTGLPQVLRKPSYLKRQHFRF